MQPSGSSVSADVGSEQNDVVNNFLTWGRVAEVVLSGIERVDVVGLNIDRELRSLDSDGPSRNLGLIRCRIVCYRIITVAGTSLEGCSRYCCH